MRTRQHLLQVAELAAVLLVAFAHAVGAGAVIAFQLGGDAGQFGQLLRIAGGGHGGHQLEQADGARGIGAHRLAFVLACLLDPVIEDGQPALVGLGGHACGIVIDVGG
ncbi:hypothetical protein D9M71_729210 [compost metagenome]